MVKEGIALITCKQISDVQLDAFVSAHRCVEETGDKLLITLLKHGRSCLDLNQKRFYLTLLINYYDEKHKYVKKSCLLYTSRCV